MRRGACNKYIALAQGPQTTNGPFAALSPEHDWVALEPFPPGGGTDRTTAYLVRLRYRADVAVGWPTLRVAYADGRTSTTRYFYVQGCQSVNEAGDEIRLVAEEVQP